MGRNCTCNLLTLFHGRGRIPLTPPGFLKVGLDLLDVRVGESTEVLQKPESCFVEAGAGSNTQ